jgi:hypothetical protein
MLEAKIHYSEHGRIPACHSMLSGEIPENVTGVRLNRIYVAIRTCHLNGFCVNLRPNPRLYSKTDKRAERLVTQHNT